MKKSSKLLVSIILLLVVCALGIKALSVESLKNEEIGEPDEVHSNFYDSKGERVATLSIMKRHYLQEDVISFRVNVWHKDGWKTKSLKLVITPNVSAEVYLKIPEGYNWNPLKLQRNRDNLNSAVLEIPDLGVQGVGSTTLDFIVVPLERTNTVLITIKAELEFSGRFKRYKGESVVDIELKKK
ncbi:hypothetical protein NF865_00780 [Thermococcus aggregans]|uniref:DUF8121 domain-containing protein n=1 Tax=Thermococcus aggregans TaxID=110163 RepID=A0A9E7SPF1_THEAG|nr:hypothetical protein [Thermococcus aggregans]USS40797.1 hypothetical protein NF865_00780 [Thermococcus aggregans]